MELDLSGRHAIVGGASRGIGRASAEALAALGAEVTCLARNAESLSQVTQGLDRAQGQAHGYLCVDYSDPEQLGSLIKSMVADKPAQILINNTGGPPDGPAHTARLEDFDTAFKQHLICNQVLMQALLPGMRQAGYGRIINIISTSVKQPIPNLGVSNTIRGAVANWAKTLAGELGPDGITVNNVLPGFTVTDRLDEIIDARIARTGEAREAIMKAMRGTVPVRRFAEPSETAAVVAFLASPAAAYINGVNVPVDGGRTGSL
jgi:3-oxoacyl-[acyl-carrier protein] reductase